MNTKNPKFEIDYCLCDRQDSQVKTAMSECIEGPATAQTFVW